MKNKKIAPLVVVGLLSAWAPAAHVDAQSQAQPKRWRFPNPGSPQIMTLEGKFVRAAYNNEGYVILGYQPAGRSIGEEWMLLEVGITVRERMPDYTLTRAAMSLETPDGKTIPLGTIAESREGNTSALQSRAKSAARLHQRLSAEGEPGVPVGFFADLGYRAMPWDQVESATRARPRAALFPRAGRHRLWPTLAQREVREESRPRALQHPDQGRREAPFQELQGHQQTGAGLLQEEGLMERTAALTSPSRSSSGARHRRRRSAKLTV